MVIAGLIITLKGNMVNWEHGADKASKAIHQEELSLGRTPMAQRQLDQITQDQVPLKISANGKLALVTHPPGLFERERLGRKQAGKPECSTGCVWNV